MILDVGLVIDKDEFVKVDKSELVMSASSKLCAVIVVFNVLAELSDINKVEFDRDDVRLNKLLLNCKFPVVKVDESCPDEFAIATCVLEIVLLKSVATKVSFNTNWVELPVKISSLVSQVNPDPL